MTLAIVLLLVWVLIYKSGRGELSYSLLIILLTYELGKQIRGCTMSSTEGSCPKGVTDLIFQKNMLMKWFSL